MKVPVSVIILTYNEEKNLPHALDSISGWAENIFIVDSGSTDETVEIAKNYGAKIKQRKFDNFATQFNWGLDNFDIKTDWVMKLDADEWLTEELKEEIAEKLKNIPDDISGLLIKRRVHFMGKWIKHGGYYPSWILRLFRRGKGRMEKRKMDEHTEILEGRVETLKNDLVDENHKDLSCWIDKHNKYATREAIAFLEEKENEAKINLGGGQVARKRWFKKNIYYHLPPFFRAFLYWQYRYFIRLGFLDGIPGLIFHFLQGFWYRFLVDSKIYEYKKRLTKN